MISSYQCVVIIGYPPMWHTSLWCSPWFSSKNFGLFSNYVGPFKCHNISCCWLTRATKSCCRQLDDCAIDYSGRASELGLIINLVDWRRPSLSCSERPPFSTKVDNTIRWSSCSGEILEVHRVWSKITEGNTLIFEDNWISLWQCRIGRRKLPRQKPARSV